MAEPWILITDSDLRKKFSEGEWDAFTASALVAGVTTVVPDAITAVVGRIRGAVRAGGLNALGPAGTVPPELLTATWDLLRVELASRVPGSGIAFDDVRKDSLADSRAYLIRIEEGKVQSITTPEEPAGTDGSGGAYGGNCYIDFSPLR